MICPPHLCEQWQNELSEKFSINSEVVRTGSAARLERGLRPDESIFQAYPYTVVSLDYIKSDRRRDDFLRACPNFVIVMRLIPVSEQTAKLDTNAISCSKV